MITENDKLSAVRVQCGSGGDAWSLFSTDIDAGVIEPH